MLRALLLLHVTALLAFAPTGLAQSKKPPLPAGRDPGGVAVALLSTGVDYTLPHIARRLARDGEGELIGWDVEDKDRHPFEAMSGDGRADDGRPGTAVAAFLASASEVRLVPVRVNPADSASLARAIAFVAHTPARVALVPAWSVRPDAWEPLQQAAGRFRDVLIIVPAGAAAAPAHATVLGLDNVLAAEPGAEGAGAAELGAGQRLPEPSRLAVAAAGKAAALLIAREPRLDAVALKRRLVEIGGDAMWRPRK